MANLKGAHCAFSHACINPGPLTRVQSTNQMMCKGHAAAFRAPVSMLPNYGASPDVSMPMRGGRGRRSRWMSGL